MTSTERDKMLRGELYVATDPELVAARDRARRLWQALNDRNVTPVARRGFLDQLIGVIGARTTIEPPFFCDYGSQIALGDDVFINYNCVFLDCAEISIGAQTKLGPAVQLYTATHPIEPSLRVAGPELARPIRIGRRVWIGGGAIVLPNVTIGDDTVVGAGSVVTRSLPNRVVAAGNPCRVIRQISETDLG